jgi:hypothetical protein
MTSVVEFVLVLAGVSIAALAAGGFGTYYFRKRAHARRLKRHFASKTQAGRPTQS